MPPKPIKATAHGLIDYGFVTAFLALPPALGLNRRLRDLFWLSGASMGALNAITAHRVAVRPLISLRVHGWLELAAVPPFVGLPIATGAVSDARARNVWLAMLAVTLTAYALTDWDAPADS